MAFTVRHLGLRARSLNGCARLLYEHLDVGGIAGGGSRETRLRPTAHFVSALATFRFKPEDKSPV
jgi:hypothetical protein